MCVKQVVDTTLPLRLVDGVVRQVSRRPISSLGPADCAALEVALALRANRGGEITALSVGQTEAVEALRFCLARGVDRAVHVRRADRLDPLGAADVALGVLATTAADLVLTGAMSGDGSSALFPAVLAQRLGWPLVTAVASVAPETIERQGESWLKVERRLERGDREVVRCPLPAVLATDGSGAEVPFIALRALRHAARFPINELAADGDDPAGWRTVALEMPRPRPKRSGGPDVRVSAMDRLGHLLSGGVQQKRAGEFVEGSPDAVAAEIVRFLEQRGFIRPGGNHG